MNETNDRGEQIAPHKVEGALAITRCMEKGISGAILPALRMAVDQSATQSQLKDSFVHSTARIGREKTAAHEPPSKVAGMPPTEIIVPNATEMDAKPLAKRKIEGHQEEAPTTTKKTKTGEDADPVVDLDLNHVTSCESVEESDEPIEGGYNDADVLAGRGGSINIHPGNIKFRMLIDHRRREYLQARKTVKPQINKAIVNIIRQKYGGRFLKRESDGLWYEIGDARAQEKVGQAFRQKAPKMRKILFGEEKCPQVELQELQQAQEQRNQVELQHLLEQGHHRQQLQQQQVHQQQLLQHQMALLSSASQGTTTAVNPASLMLSMNPLLQLQQQAATTNPLFNPLFMTNNIMAPVFFPFVQVPTSTIAPTPLTIPPTTGNTNGYLEQLKQALSGSTGGHVLPAAPPPPRSGP